jgi:hypothetical protein
MKKITSVSELRNEISLLEKKKKDDAVLLKKEIHLVFESLKPVNLVKSTFNELTASPEIKGNILNVALGHVTGYLSKKIIVGATRNPLKKLFGAVLQIGVAKIVTKNSEGIKSTGLNFIKKIFNKKPEQFSAAEEK